MKSLEDSLKEVEKKDSKDAKVDPKLEPEARSEESSKKEAVAGKEEAPAPKQENPPKEEERGSNKQGGGQRNQYSRNRKTGGKKHFQGGENARNGPKELQPFDFEKSNSRFDKDKARDEVVKEVSDSEQAPIPEGTSYQKDDFFDTLSCETLEKQKEQSTKQYSFDDQRKRDMETFGPTSVLDQHRMRGNRGRRYHSYHYRSYNRGAGGQVFLFSFSLLLLFSEIVFVDHFFL